MDNNEIAGIIISSLFVSGEAVDTEVFYELTGEDGEKIEAAIDSLAARLEKEKFGIVIKRIENKVQLCTNGLYATHIRTLFVPPVNESLTTAMIETLSIVAYKQPATRSEVNDIRGVHSNYAISALIERGLVREAGRKDVLGRPALLVTTEEFLRHFGISSLEELPQIDFEIEQGQSTVQDDAQSEPILEV